MLELFHKAEKAVRDLGEKINKRLEKKNAL
jgi:hypothetical protein